MSIWIKEREKIRDHLVSRMKTSKSKWPLNCFGSEKNQFDMPLKTDAIDLIRSKIDQRPVIRD